MMDARDALAQLFGIEDILRIVFTKNATEALNIALAGLLRPGDHVVTSAMEHNSVMRPLRFLESRGVGLSVIPCGIDGRLPPDELRREIRPETRLIVAAHASNVTGTLQPISELGAIARECGIHFCVDAAQSAGAAPVDVDAMGIDILAFSGHKSLYGPQGTGGIYLRAGMEALIQPMLRGGTGSRSEYEEQPDFMPDKYESGTPNAIGIAGLGAAVRFVLGKGVETIRRFEEALTRRFLEGLAVIDGVTIYGPKSAAERTAVVSFNIDGVACSDASQIMDERFGILCRPGLHCAPAAHRTIGTFPQGTIRFGFSCFNTDQEISLALEAVASLVRGKYW